MGEVKECIDRAEAIRICERLRDKTDNEDMAFALNWAIQSIKGITAEDVKPVKHGEWIGYPECLKYQNAYADEHIVCSVCEECFSILDNCAERFDFCPHCGADMREINDETT